MSIRRTRLLLAAQKTYAEDETAFLVVTTEDDTTYQVYIRDANTTRINVIDWGDGTKEAVSTGTTAFKAFQHIYSTPNEYEVRIKGLCYGIDLTNYGNTYGKLVKEWFHASLGLTAMQDWASFASIRAIGSKFALPPNLQTMVSFAREGTLPSGAYTKLQIPDTVTNLDGAFSNIGGGDFDITNLFDKWTTKSLSRNLRIAFSRYSRNYIVGTAPTLWEQGFTFSNTTNAFGACTRLTNYNDIPASWGGGGA